MRKPMIAGNWKMNTTLEEATLLLSNLVKSIGNITSIDTLICPPFTHLMSLVELASGTSISIGSQNMHFEDHGAYTGEISPLVLKELGCSHVILGHSERRHIFNESDYWINMKVISALRHGLKPILCVGESLEQRNQNQTFETIKAQLSLGLANIDPNLSENSEIIIAYEPVWAIGTGKVATPNQAQEVHAFIRKELHSLLNVTLAKNIRILYGGSVKPENIESLISKPDIDGALIGGASLSAESFTNILLKSQSLLY